jgi:hypothetical protein
MLKTSYTKVFLLVQFWDTLLDTKLKPESRIMNLVILNITMNCDDRMYNLCFFPGNQVPSFKY